MLSTNRVAGFISLFFLIFSVFIPFAGVGNNNAAYADGENSPDVCKTGFKSAEDPDDVVVMDAGTGFTIDGVCIKSGDNMFTSPTGVGWIGPKHSGVLNNGTYENNCYTVAGVGTQIVTVTRIGSGNNCKDISHVDALTSRVINGNGDEGSVRVNKKVDADGDGVFEGGNTEGNALGFRWGIDNDPTDNLMGSTEGNVPEGAHSVSENSISGFDFVGWYSANSRFSCENPEATTHPVPISVIKDATTEITLCNSKQPEQPTDGEPQITQMAAPVGGVEAGGGGTAASATAPLLGLGGSLSAVGYSLLRMRRN